MKLITTFILSMSILLLAGCDDSDKPSGKSASPNPSPPSSQQARPSVEQQLQEERDKRSQLELTIHRIDERRVAKEAEMETSRSRWQVGAMLLGCGCIVSLFVGAALGTKARNHGSTP